MSFDKIFDLTAAGVFFNFHNSNNYTLFVIRTRVACFVGIPYAKSHGAAHCQSPFENVTKLQLLLLSLF